MAGHTKRKGGVGEMKLGTSTSLADGVARGNNLCSFWLQPHDTPMRKHIHNNR